MPDGVSCNSTLLSSVLGEGGGVVVMAIAFDDPQLLEVSQLPEDDASTGKSPWSASLPPANL